MIRIILILFLLISPANAKCKYYAEADVVNDKLINKKENYTCKENDNFIVQFATEEKYQHAFDQVITWIFIVALETL